MPESVISSIDQNTPVTVSFGAISGVQFSGEVTKVSTAGTSAAFPVVVKVHEKHPSLRSGLAADVEFRFHSDPETNTFVLPVAAVINDPEGTFVFIADETGSPGEAVVHRRKVTLGELTRAGVEILDGIEPGDKVITAGISVIREDLHVLLP